MSHRMVDVSAKEETRREARAGAFVRLSPATLEAVRAGKVPKGDVLSAARLAGIAAAKQTPHLLTFCHPIRLTSVDVDLEPTDEGLVIEATARALDRTGVEMEALTAASVAALTVYDMCKSLERGITIEWVRLEEKSGGRSGHWVRRPTADPEPSDEVRS